MNCLGLFFGRLGGGGWGCRRRGGGGGGGGSTSAEPEYVPIRHIDKREPR